MLLDINPKLTGFESPVTQAAARTHAGMAHFAGSGPALLTCRECRFWRKTNQWMKHAPKPASCAEFNRLSMERDFGPLVPHDAAACKYFSASDEAQPLVRPVKNY